jgi:hypothetical protein
MKTTACPLDRRQFLSACAAGLAMVIDGPGCNSPRGDDVAQVVDWLLRLPAAEGLARAAKHLGDGDENALLDAVGIAAATAIPSDVPRFNHVALATHSVRQLIADAPPASRRLRCLWLVNAFHHERDRLANGWRLAEQLPSAAPGDPAAAVTAALDAWDANAADQAVVDLAAARGAAAALEVVRRYGLRCQANLGHKAIHLAAVDDLLPRVPEPHRITVLRAMVRSFGIHGRNERAATFDAARRLAGERAVGDGRADVVLRAMRRGEPGPALQAMAAVAADGTAWDTVLAHAAETTLADHGVAPLHATTAAVAMAETSRNPAAHRDAELARLQAAAFQAWFRATPSAARPHALRLETIVAKPFAAADSPLAEALRAAATSPAGALPGILALSPPDRASLVQQFRQHVIEKAHDLHHVKLAAAVLTTLPHVGTSAGAALLAAALMHAPAVDEPLEPGLRRLQVLLER